MNLSKQFLLSVFCVLPFVASAQVATTAGSNLTAWNGNAGATNNNNWNQLMNSRSGTASGAKADFGNCNSLILRCAQPKCAACSSMELAKPVVAGCVNSNKTCKKHGDDLIEFIAAQIVANAAQKQQQQEMQIQAQAAQQAAAQNSAQVQQLQSQIQQMQSSMQQQNATQMAQMQAALDEQKELVRQAQNEAAAAQRAKNDAQNAQSASSGVTVAQQKAIDSGVSEEILLRQQASGEILTSVDNAEMSLKSMKATLQDLFDYAGCDSRGGNCYGPKRVKVFKDKARPVFEEFNNVIDELYEALETSLMLGVDVSDVLMMLSGSCNRWARYMCHSNGKEKGSDGNTERAVHKVARYGAACDKANADGTCCAGGMVPNSCVNGRSQAESCTDGDDVTYTVKGGQDCTPGGVVPPADDGLCTAIGTISADDSEDVQRQWVDENYDGDRMIRVGCLSNQLDSLALFGGRRRKKASTLDLDTLERILEQDAHDIGTSSIGYSEGDTEKFKYCGLTTDGYKKLEKAIRTNKFIEKDVCVASDRLKKELGSEDYVRSVARDYYPDNIPGVTEDVCNDTHKDVAFWHKTKGCVVRFIVDADEIDLLAHDDNCKKDDGSGDAYKTCGTFNYWDKDNDKLEKVDTDEEQCQLHRGQWLNDKDTIEKKGYNLPGTENACCICAPGYKNCMLETGKVCEKDKDDDEDS